MAKVVSLSGSGVVKGAGGRVFGLVIGSASSATVKIWDGVTAAGRVILETTTAVSAPLNLPFPAPAETTTGIFLTIGGTGTVTVFYD